MSSVERLLFASSELAPWAKTGGLGDISAALPVALAQAGVDLRLLLPGYPRLIKAFPEARLLLDLPSPGGALPASRLLEAQHAGLRLWLIDCPSLYQRGGEIYHGPDGVDWPDNHLRFGLLSRLAAWLASDDSPLPWRPQLLHCNDWQTGLAPAYLHYLHGGGPPAVMTIHNLAFQGLFPPQTLSELGLPPEALSLDGVEFYGHLSFLKAGLQFARQITTVSPSYAREIQTAELGFALDGLLSWRSKDLTGILNGVDASWNPASDPDRARPYDAAHLAGNTYNRRALCAELGLSGQAAQPLLAIVSRLTHQKGMDLVLAAADQFLAENASPRAQLVVLGHGETAYEQGFRALAARYPGQVAAIIDFSERLAHRIEAAADIFLMPSRFEPCGLNQLYSLRYGTPPVVHATGGLADTVVDCSGQNLEDGRANGFCFASADAPSFAAALKRAIALWHDEKRWRRLQRQGMAADFSWQKAALRYFLVYDKALGT